MSNLKNNAEGLHEEVPMGWYYYSIRRNLIQRYVHTRRFREVEKLIEPKGGNILDIGCADGAFTEVILAKSKAKRVTAIDVSEKNISWAKKHWKKTIKIKFVVGDAHHLKFKNHSFDAVFALEVLEHVFEPKKVLKEIKRVLIKGGYGIFLVPAENLLFRTIWYFWSNYYVGRVWKHTHLHAYNKDYLITLSKRTGLTIEVDKKIIFGCLHLIKVRKK